jgi:carbon storage regulator
MLILSRRVGETLLIDGDIKIVVLECARNGVRLGIEAPPEVTIWRGELIHSVVDETGDEGAPTV